MASGGRGFNLNVPKVIPGLGANGGDLDLSQFGDQAQQLWAMLDDLATDDPEGYKNFITKQLSEAKAAVPSIKPSPGISLACPILRRNTGSSLPTTTPEDVLLDCGPGTVIAVNICQHEAVGAPLDSFNQPVKNENDATSGLQIPLSVGTVRRLEGPAKLGVKYAIDVVVHPWVLRRIMEPVNRVFKVQVLDLALEWIKNETGLCLQRTGESELDIPYVGGRVVNGQIECVEHTVQTSKPSQRATLSTDSTNTKEGVGEHPQDKRHETSEEILKSPASLLKGLTMESSEGPAEVTELKTLGPGPKRDAKPLIEEVSPSKGHLEEPRFRMEVKNATTSSSQLLITIEVPKLQSLRDADLEISESKLRLEVVDTYHLQLTFPQRVSEESAKAKLLRKKQQIVITIDMPPAG